MYIYIYIYIYKYVYIYIYIYTVSILAQAILAQAILDQGCRARPFPLTELPPLRHRSAVHLSFLPWRSAQTIGEVRVQPTMGGLTITNTNGTAVAAASGPRTGSSSGGGESASSEVTAYRIYTHPATDGVDISISGRTTAWAWVLGLRLRSPCYSDLRGSLSSNNDKPWRLWSSPTWATGNGSSTATPQLPWIAQPITLGGIDPTHHGRTTTSPMGRQTGGGTTSSHQPPMGAVFIRGREDALGLLII